MSQKTDSRYCPHCQKQTLALASAPNHVLHLILTLATVGLWAFVWIALALVGSPYRCSKCGVRV